MRSASLCAARVSCLLLASSLALGCDRSRSDEAHAPAQGKRETTAEDQSLDALLAALEHPKEGVAAYAALRKLAYEVGANGSPEARAELAARMLPALESRWAAGPPDERLASLTIAMSLADPAGAGLWRLALSGDDREQTRLALDGIAASRAWTLADAVLARWERELPALDPHDEAHASMFVALTEVLGHARNERAVEPMLRLLERPDIERSVPRAVTKASVSALGHIADPRAVDTLLTLQFRVADTPGTQSVGERCVRALGAIGEAALPGVLMAFAGNNRRLEQLSREHGLPPAITSQVMVRILGVIASPRAVDPLIAGFPTQGCDGHTPAEPDQIMLRAFHANALGWIADPRSVPTLCACTSSHTPTDAWEVVSALGRTGGAEAFACLVPVVESGSYDTDAVAPGHELDLRSDSFRYAALAAGSAQLPQLEALLASALPEVRARIEAEGYARALDLLRDCGEELACNLEVLADAQRDPFTRERAAFSVARTAAPGELEVAAALARAFTVQEPSVRLHMPWLAAKLADGRACAACADALETTMEAERMNVPATMQGAWIVARQSIDKFRAGRSD